MRHTDITCPYTGTSAHPYVATIDMDPAEWAMFESTFEDRPEVQQLGVDRSSADEWTVYAACDSRSVRDLLESNWEAKPDGSFDGHKRSGNMLAAGKRHISSADRHIRGHTW